MRNGGNKEEMTMTLEDILVEYFGLRKLQDDTAWNEAYDRLVQCVYRIGALTGYNAEASRIVDIIDKIDTQNGEI